jgi:hypothetical protein
VTGPDEHEEEHMATALLLAWTSPVPGRAVEYAEWLDSVHIPEVQAAVPTIRRSSRHRLDVPPESAGTPRFLVVHELDTDDIATASAQLDGALEAGRVTTSPDMDLTVQPPRVEWHVHESDIGPEETR